MNFLVGLVLGLVVGWIARKFQAKITSTAKTAASRISEALG